ncbi:VWA domain-containing protein, partial [bacterium]
ERHLLALRLVPPPSGRSVPAQSLAIVIDRSGSMDGRPIELAREAALRMCGSLRREDRVAIVAYDDRVEIVRALGPALPAPEDAVSRIGARGSTDLYGGWLAGAKALPRYGRILLLSDGQANVGRYTDAAQLAREAELSFHRYRITTSTLGIGRGYDERIMASMARQGGGNAYFAEDAESIASAVSAERAAIANVALLHMTVSVGGRIVEIGHLDHGMGKTIAIELPNREAGEVSLRFTGPDRRETLNVTMPTSFGHSDEATLAFYLERASRALHAALELRDSRSAERAAEGLRSAMLPILAHPFAERPEARYAVATLESAIAAAERLSRSYSEEDAVYERKRSAQFAHNVAHKDRAYASVQEDMLSLGESVETVDEPVDPTLLSRLPMEVWRKHRAYPMRAKYGPIEVGMENPKDGFGLAELEKRLGQRVVATPASSEAVDAALA